MKIKIKNYQDHNSIDNRQEASEQMDVSSLHKEGVHLAVIQVRGQDPQLVLDLLQHVFSVEDDVQVALKWCDWLMCGRSPDNVLKQLREKGQQKSFVCSVVWKESASSCCYLQSTINYLLFKNNKLLQMFNVL